MKELRFVVSLITQENDYQREQAAAAQEAAVRLGVQVQTMFADNDAINQSQQLLTIVQTPDAGVDAILLEPPAEPVFPRWRRPRWPPGWRGDCSIANPTT